MKQAWRGVPAQFGWLLVMLIGLAGLVGMQALVPATAHAQEDTEFVEHTVAEGEALWDIAERMWNRRSRYDIIYWFNPHIEGKGPDEVRPGTRLRLPVRAPRNRPPPATVTQTRRRVDSRSAEEEEWNAASTGQGLYRGWRVTTRERATAELTFRDTSVIEMRQNTLVIIMGASSRRSRQRAQSAQLERGTLRSRLGELSMDVTTPTGEAALTGGDQVVRVEEDGTSSVSNFEGGEAEVRSTGQTSSVRVRPGFGTAVRRARPPMRPRPLPPAPAWAPGQRRFISLGGRGGTVAASWTAVEVAAHYMMKVAQYQDGRGVVGGGEVPSATTNFEVQNLVPGTYYTFVNTIDGDSLVSRPSDALQVEVLQVDLVLPGAEEAIPFEQPAAGESPGTPTVLEGTHVRAPDGIVCGIGEEREAEFVLRESGEVTCADAEGNVLGGFAVEVSAVELAPTDPAELILIQGEPHTHTFEIVSDLELPPMNAYPSEGVTVSSFSETSPGTYSAVIEVAESAPSEVLVRFGPTPEDILAEQVFQVRPPEPEPEPEPPPPVIVEPEPEPLSHLSTAFGGVESPRWVGLDDPFSAGSGANFSLARSGDNGDSGERMYRASLGFGVDIAGVVRAGLAGTLLFDTRGTIDQRAGSADARVFAEIGLIDEETIQLSAGLSVWLPFGDSPRALDALRVVPGGTVGVLVGPVVLRTRQALLIDLVTDNSSAFAWASAYGVDVRVGPHFSFGGELDVIIGDLGEGSIFGVGAGVGVALTIDALSISVGPRFGLTEDYSQVGGELTLAGNVRLVF